MAFGTIIHPIGEASTASFSNGSGVGPTPRGWDFTITQAISVEQLGVNAGVDGVTITLSLWDVTTQSLLVQTTATSEAFGWVFADISPLILNPGDTYSVIGWADTTNTGIPWYIFNNDPPAEFNPTGIVNYLNTRFDNGIGPNDFPTQILGAPAQYGVTDIGYELVTTPEPASLILVGSALAFVIRKRRQ
jgi:hypothetical protein